MKATGELIWDKSMVASVDIDDGTEECFNVNLASVGDIVTIELPKGMKVIGKCNTCSGPHEPDADEPTCRYIAKGNGCILWKPRRKV